MNTPTPAQALGEVIRHRSASDFAGPMVWHDIDDNEWSLSQREFMASCVNLAVQHGQHFAGLEARAESLARSLQMSEELRATSEGNLIRADERAERAEFRVREAEGLLRHWQAWICGPSELHKATATFIAANGETK